MSITSDLIRGHTDTIILASLMGGDSYGYKIIKTFSSKPIISMNLRRQLFTQLSSVLRNPVV